jgi:hypothetical protein
VEEAELELVAPAGSLVLGVVDVLGVLLAWSCVGCGVSPPLPLLSDDPVVELE